MFGLSPWEIGLIFLVVLLLFGARRLPEIGRSMGRGIREFKSSVEGKDKDKDKDDETDADAETEMKEPAAKS